MDSAPSPLVDVQELRYAYRGLEAVRGMTFAVQRGSIHGFIGPNGAGKTTTLKIFATLLRPQRGTVRLFGHDLVREYKQVRRKVGFMPDHFSTYRQMTVQEYLDFFGAAYGLDFAARTRTLDDVLALTDMQSRRHDFLKNLSRGMQQRVSLARVLMHDPELLLLDEPASGLDPRARIELMEILQELRRLGKTIFISSHILSELALLCDAVTIIDRGLVKYSGAMASLVRRDGVIAEYLLSMVALHEPTADVLRKLPGVVEVKPVEDGTPQYQVNFHREQTTPNAILQLALDSGAQIVSFQEQTRHLNEAFMDLTEPGVPPIIPPTVAPPSPIVPRTDPWNDAEAPKP